MPALPLQLMPTCAFRVSAWHPGPHQGVPDHCGAPFTLPSEKMPMMEAIATV